MISLIAAISENNVIGHKGEIPWHLPRDFKFFKDTTMGHPIVMGRRTYESIGRPLPGRENIVLSRQKDLEIDGCVLVHTIEDILKREEDLFIIGGAELYRQFLPHADKIFLTRVHTTVEGDALFPDIDNTWKLTSSEEFKKDEKNEYNMTFEVYEKRK